MLHALGRKILQGLKLWFGDFTKEELKKFLTLGFIFTLVIGVYWTLRPLKDGILMSMLTKDAQPIAKLISLLFVFPIVIAYSKVVDLFPRHKLFYAICGIYAAFTLVFAVLLSSQTFGLPFVLPGGQLPAVIVAERTGLAYYMSLFVAYGFYVFVESFGSIVVTMFWGFVTDITLPQAAKAGFPLIALIGQIGGIVLPQTTKLPRYLQHNESLPVLVKVGSTIPLIIAAALMLLIIVMVSYFMRVTPKSQLVGFHGVEEKKSHAKNEEAEPSFLEGLKLVLSNFYLFGIFSIITFFEVIATFFDFNFKGAVDTHLVSVAEKNSYLGDYGSTVNLVTFLCLLLGINNIQRFFGITVSLVLIPLWFGASLVAFMWFPGHLEFLFWLMITSKAINYALNGPSMKQLYVPTTKEVRYKSQAWIEAFGSRGAKAISSGVNSMQKTLQASYGKVEGLMYHMQLTQYIGLGMVGLWFFAALYLGVTQKKAVDENRVVC